MALLSRIFTARRSFSSEDLPVATLKISAGRQIPADSMECFLSQHVVGNNRGLPERGVAFRLTNKWFIKSNL
jgi:hypothetical protein